MCLRFPEWPLQRHCSARPKDKSRPVVLYAPGAGGKTRVVACSRIARGNAGVVVGMVLAEAQGLWPGGRNFVRFEPHDLPLVDHHALRDLAGWCQQFSPVVALDSAAASDCLAAGCGLAAEQSFGSESGFAEKAVDSLRKRTRLSGCGYCR